MSLISNVVGVSNTLTDTIPLLSPSSSATLVHVVNVAFVSENTPSFDILALSNEPPIVVRVMSVNWQLVGAELLGLNCFKVNDPPDEESMSIREQEDRERWLTTTPLSSTPPPLPRSKGLESDTADPVFVVIIRSMKVMDVAGAVEIRVGAFSYRWNVR